MDLSKLRQSDLSEFLSLPYPGFQPYSQTNPLSPVEQANQRFEQLLYLTFPLPVIDLYLANSYKGPRDTIYSSDEIFKLTLEDIKAFDQVFHFNAARNSPEVNRGRIHRILSYLGLITSPEEILLRGELLENLCQELSLEDLNTFRLAYNQVSLSCPVVVREFNEIDGRVFRFNEFNELTYQVAENILREGLDGSLIEQAGLNNLQAVQLLLKLGADVNATDNSGHTALMTAASHNHHLVVITLLDSGADLEVVDEWGFNALLLAVEECHILAASTLIDRGANVNARDNYEETALIKAAHNGCEEIVTKLLKKDANVDDTDNHGQTALMRATQYGHDKIVVKLLDYKANINAVDQDFNTALMLASENDEEEEERISTVALLLIRGADFDRVNADGKTALMLANENGHIEIAKLLRWAGATR